jgi:hypothetical protein
MKRSPTLWAIVCIGALLMVSPQARANPTDDQIEGHL